MSKKNKKVLIAEDNESLLKLYSDVLEKEGILVIKTKNGKECVEKATEETPCLIFLDIIMPKMDGYEALKLLRGNEKTKGTKIIVLTNLANEEDRETAMSLGADEYFIKTDLSMANLVLAAKKCV